MATKLKINLYGDGWSLKKIELESIQKEYFEQIAKRTNQTLHQAIIDPFFYPKLLLSNIQSHYDLKATTLFGLKDTNKNQIEIWYDGKKISKFKMADLSPEYSIFPTYNSKVTLGEEEQKIGIYIEEFETGKIGSYEIEITDLNLENICFHLFKYDTFLLLHQISYKDSILKIKNRDTLINRQNSFVIE
ncbi:hypothetical protein [Flavobacterium ovatum]|uniref:hypothetical protein n=1 Tax=Flavobacterium ovatum TaxID=1928857 RepID=UPI0034504A53